MKSILSKFIPLIFFVFLTFNLYSQITPPPPPDEHALKGDQRTPGGGAPIDGGLFFLLGLGTVYGAYKLHKNLKENKTETLSVK